MRRDEEGGLSMAQRNHGLLRNTSTFTLALHCRALRPGFSLLGRWNENGMEKRDPDETRGYFFK